MYRIKKNQYLLVNLMKWYKFRANYLLEMSENERAKIWFFFLNFFFKLLGYKPYWRGTIKFSNFYILVIFFNHIILLRKKQKRLDLVQLVYLHMSMVDLDPNFFYNMIKWDWIFVVVKYVYNHYKIMTFQV